MTYRPRFGAVPGADGTRFRVWAPLARAIEVVIERDGRAAGVVPLAGPLVVPLAPSEPGVFEGVADNVRAGARYRLTLDGDGPYPDPASRFQPEGVHGPSQVVDPNSFQWSDAGWRGVALEDLVLYELHVGTFTPEGTFAAAAARLPDLAALGVTAVELMPLADFPGARNWGYDGAALFAPARCYGAPDDLRRFVDASHALGLAVHLDVVYNHFGPDGAYAAAFSPRFFHDRRRTPWGRALNFDGEGAHDVRAFFVDNALHWIHEYHLDGLRLDSTHDIGDDGPVHFVAELASSVRASLESPGPGGRMALVIAEDGRNLATTIRPREAGGWGLDAVWSDDFHHQVRVHLTGERDGYFADFDGTAGAIATTLERGWTFVGQPPPTTGRARGSDPGDAPPDRFVFYVQNHDQVGNPGAGDRLHRRADPAAVRAATALLLCAPQTPLLFMGQEWMASTPFRFFTDHAPELGARIRPGRLREFARFSAYAAEGGATAIADPQAEDSFLASRLDWGERAREPHASALRFHRALLALRRTAPRGPHAARALDPHTVMLVRGGPDGPALAIVARLDGAGGVEAPLEGGPNAWRAALTTEDDGFADTAAPIGIAPGAAGVRVTFPRAGAVVFERRASAPPRVASASDSAPARA